MIFTIKEGKHYAKGKVCRVVKNFMSPLKGDFYKFLNVKFSRNCLYEFTDEDRYDINKLFGVGYGNHHDNSVRFGWRCDWDKQAIIPSVYLYINGKRTFKEFENNLVFPEKFTLFTIIRKGNLFDMMINGRIICTADLSNIENKGYNLFPYFGGNKTAPHTMNIELKKLI